MANQHNATKNRAQRASWHLVGKTSETDFHSLLSLVISRTREQPVKATCESKKKNRTDKDERKVKNNKSAR